HHGGKGVDAGVGAGGALNEVIDVLDKSTWIQVQPADLNIESELEFMSNLRLQGVIANIILAIRKAARRFRRQPEITLLVGRGPALACRPRVHDDAVVQVVTQADKPVDVIVGSGKVLAIELGRDVGGE